MKPTLLHTTPGTLHSRECAGGSLEAQHVPFQISLEAKGGERKLATAKQERLQLAEASLRDHL